MEFEEKQIQREERKISIKSKEKCPAYRNVLRFVLILAHGGTGRGEGIIFLPNVIRPLEA